MKVLFLISDLFRIKGGIQVFNDFFIKALIHLGHQVSVVSCNDIAPLDGSDGYGLSNFSPSGKYKYLRKLTFIADAWRQILSFKPHAIFCGHVHFSPLGMLMSKLCRIPYFTITHGVDVWKLNRINLYGLKKSGKILTVSRFTRNKILAQLPDYAEKDIFIIPNTFDPEKFRPGPKPQHLMERMKLDKSDKVLFTVARLAKSEQHKGYDKVILAMSNVVKELPNVKFIIGGTGDDGGRIKQMIRQNGLETTVLLPGFIPDAELPDYYNLCDVFVMPSKKEGFGIVFLEALACGKPVVCGKQDGSVDPVLDGETGILVDPDNTQEIENAILKILRGEVDQHHLDGEYLRTRTLEEYGIDAFRTKVNRFMEEELDGNC